MKLRLTVHSGRRVPGQPAPGHGQYVAWVELGGEVVGGELARHTNREAAEHLARHELVRRLGLLLAGPVRPVARPLEGERSA